MKVNSSDFSIHIKKQAIVNTKYFVYHHKSYPVNFDLLKNNSIYFYKNQDKFQDEQEIELINEIEEYVKLSDESIQAFISCCQNEPCSINKSSIIPLQYLAHKFEFNELIKITDKFTEEHSEELILDTLFFKILKMKEKNNNSSFFDTSKEEKFISDHLSDFIQKEEMLNLPIQLLHRALNLFYQKGRNLDELKGDMTSFLFKCLDKFGKPASILFNIIDFEEKRIEFVNRLLENYSDKFDFNMINRTLTKTVKDLTSEVIKQKEEYCQLFKQMQETFKEQLAVLKEMKKQEEEKQKQNEIDNKKRDENFSSYVNKIKNKVYEEMKSMQDQFKQICIKQEEFIDNAAVKKYHQMVLETTTFGQFLIFDEELKDHFKTEFDKIEQKLNKEDSLYAKIILDYISIPESCENIQILQIFKGDVKNHAKIKITNDIIEDFNQKEQLDSFLTKCVNISNDILVEIEYPCNKFEQKMKIISDVKTQKCQNIKVSVTINDKSYFEQKYEWNKNVNISKVGNSIDAIPDEGFCDFCNLSDFEMNHNIVTIGSSSFKNCSSLTQVNIPTSVKSISANCFEGCSKLDRIPINPFYTEIQFNKFNKCPSLDHFSILTTRDKKSKTRENIFISYNITDILYKTSFLDSSELTSYI